MYVQGTIYQYCVYQGSIPFPKFYTPHLLLEHIKYKIPSYFSPKVQSCVLFHLYFKITHN